MVVLAPLRWEPAAGRRGARDGGDPALLVAAQATRGLDIGAVEGVHQLLREQRDRGRRCSISAPS